MRLNRLLWNASLWMAMAVTLALGCAPADSTSKTDKPDVNSPAQPVEQPTDETAPAADETAEKPAETAVEQVAMVIEVPLGLPEVPVPADNPMTPAKVELGKMLYFDKRLSKDGSNSCATCHDPTKAWAEHSATSTGIGNQVGGANSPSVINSAYATTQFWDGRAASLEEQALGPIENPIEMGHNLGELVKQLNEIDGYKQKFQEVFGTDVTKENLAKAIAAFERTVLSGNSPYDKFVAGNETALSDQQKRGLEVFKDAGCASCHKPPVFSNYRFINAGVGMDKAEPDKGRMGVTNEESDLGKYRVPALREVANTAPYFHDGSAKTLAEAVALMAAGGRDNPNLSGMMKRVGTKNLSDEDQQALVAFMESLSGDYPVIEAPQLP